MNAPLPIQVVRDIAALKAGWMFVGAAFQEPSPHCEECGYCEHKGQMLPYGESQAYEAYCECTLGQRSFHKPEDCPAYAAHLAELAEEQQ